MLNGTVEGRSDYQSMGTLVVYSTAASDDDNLGAVTIKGGEGTGDAADYDSATAWPAGWTRNDVSDAEMTENTDNIGITSFASRTVTSWQATSLPPIPTGSS